MKYVRYYLPPNAKPTPEQIAEIERAAQFPVVPDENCPAQTEEELKEFYRVSKQPRGRKS